MFIDKQPKDKIEKYIEWIQVACSLSKLFSESDKPFIYYRLTENLFCECLEADNVSRTDCSIDAKMGKFGIGVKTFLEGAKKASPQKIAEFNKESNSLSKLSDDDLVKRVSELRNMRLELTKRTYGVSILIYHCITRDSGIVHITESNMDPINLDKIRIIKRDDKGKLSFTDGKHTYGYNKSKSTLYMDFDLSNPVYEFEVSLLDNPLELFDEIAEKIPNMPKAVVKQFVVLPLFSIKKGGTRYVPEKSGLNQWNAAGRLRDYNEVYIPVPARLRREYPKFFPPRDVQFRLRLPDGSELQAKICQDSDKALMTNPNSALGKWILRDVLELDPGKLLTYEMLEDLGIDHISITKNEEGDYSIDFMEYSQGELSVEDLSEVKGDRVLQSKLL